MFTIQGEESLYHGVQELLPDDPSDIEHSGKMSVLFKMLQHLHSMSREKIVVVSNFTQVCVCVCACVHVYMCVLVQAQTILTEIHPLSETIGRPSEPTVFE